MSKISWSKALADYLKDETQSYASIAREYGVSKQSVVKRAVKEGWQDLRHKTLLEVDQKLTELVGEDIAIVNARHAQMGRLLQAVALKAIKEGNLKLENFMQALRAVVEGVKIERETFDMKGARELRLREVIGRDRGIFNTPEFARRYSFKDDSDKTKELKSAVSPSVQRFVQTTPDTPVLTPDLLEEIQRQLKDIQERAEKIKERANRL